MSIAKHTERPKFKNKLSAFRLPEELDAKAKEKCSYEDITFSQLMRRALRRELAEAGIKVKEEKQ